MLATANDLNSSEMMNLSFSGLSVNPEAMEVFKANVSSETLALAKSTSTPVVVVDMLPPMRWACFAALIPSEDDDERNIIVINAAALTAAIHGNLFMRWITGDILTGNALAHELEHVRQVKSGDLSFSDDGCRVWKGRRWGKLRSQLLYALTPWEREAFVAGWRYEGKSVPLRMMGNVAQTAIGIALVPPIAIVALSIVTLVYTIPTLLKRTIRRRTASE